MGNTEQQEELDQLRFINFHNGFYGGNRDNIKDIQNTCFSGKELFAYVTAFNKSISEHTESAPDQPLMENTDQQELELPPSKYREITTDEVVKTLEQISNQPKSIPDVEEYLREYIYKMYCQKIDIKESLIKSKRVLDFAESFASLAVEQARKEWEKEKMGILTTAVNAIHLNDSADYYRGLYSIIHKIVPEYIRKKDLNDLYKELNPR